MMHITTLTLTTKIAMNIELLLEKIALFVHKNPQREHTRDQVRKSLLIIVRNIPFQRLMMTIIYDFHTFAYNTRIYIYIHMAFQNF